MPDDSKQSAEQTPKRKRQFSLAGLLIFMLALTPAFMALPAAAKVDPNRIGDTEFHEFAVGLIYVPVLTLISYFRRRKWTGSLRQISLWCLGRGVIYGVLYYLLLFVPVEIVKKNTLHPNSGWKGWSVVIINGLVPATAVGVFLGGGIGMATGLAVGLFRPKANGDGGPKK